MLLASHAWCLSNGNSASAAITYNDCGAGPTARDYNCHNGRANTNSNDYGGCYPGTLADGIAPGGCGGGAVITTWPNKMCNTGTYA